MLNKYVLILVFSVFVASCSQILLKIASGKEHDSIIKEYWNPQVIIGSGMMFASTILTILAFKGLDYKNGPIIESVGYIFIMILSRIFLKEKISIKERICIGTIIISTITLIILGFI